MDQFYQCDQVTQQNTSEKDDTIVNNGEIFREVNQSN